jgi:hypothetical protein
LLRTLDINSWQFAVRENNASDEIMMPGVINPPTYSPAALIALKVVAVPKSTTMQGLPVGQSPQPHNFDPHRHPKEAGKVSSVQAGRAIDK